MKTHYVKRLFILALGLSLVACQQNPNEDTEVKHEIIEEIVPVEEKVELETMNYDEFLEVHLNKYFGPYSSSEATVYLTRLDEDITVRDFFSDYFEAIQKMQLSKEKSSELTLDKPFEIRFVFEEQKEIRFQFQTDGQVLVNDEVMYLMNESDIDEIYAVNEYDHFLEAEHLRFESVLPKSEEIESVRINYYRDVENKDITLTNPDSIENLINELGKRIVYKISEEDKGLIFGGGGAMAKALIQLKNGEVITYEHNPLTIIRNGESHYYMAVFPIENLRIDYFPYLEPFGFETPTFKINDTVFEAKVSAYQYHGDVVVDHSEIFLNDKILTFTEGDLCLSIETLLKVNVSEETKDGFKILEAEDSKVMLPNEVGEHLIVIDLSDENDNVVTYKKWIEVSALPLWFNDMEMMDESSAAIVKNGAEIKVESFEVVEQLKKMKLSAEKGQSSVEIADEFELIIENSTEKVIFEMNQEGIFMDGVALYPTIDCTIQSEDFVLY